MKALCLCPVYNHPQRLTENALACFLDQTIQESPWIVVGDDRPSGQLDSGVDRENGIIIATFESRFTSMGAKYNAMVKAAREYGAEFDTLVIWDDDDHYFPRHLELMDLAYLANPEADWAYPERVYSTFGRALRQEDSGGRFWASCSLKMSLYDKMGGFAECREMSFDQQALGAMRTKGVRCTPESGYVYNWEITNADHASGHSAGYTCTAWYHKTPASRSTGPLNITYTEEGMWLLREADKLGKRELLLGDI